MIENIKKVSKTQLITSESLLNEVRQIIYSLYRAKNITKKVYNNIMNSIKVKCKMDAIFMNCKKIKHIINITD